MTKAIIIDNESSASNQLSALLRQYCNESIHFNGAYTSLSEAMPGLKKHQPQLVFMDAKLHQQAGDQLTEKELINGCLFVFCSDTEQLAYHAFRHNAIDYLLKPYDAGSILRVAKKISQRKPTDNISRKFDNLLGNIEQLKQYTPPKKIMIPTISGFELLPVIDIIRCQSDINYTTIFIRNRQKLVVAKTLKEFEEMLGEYNFFRIHNSHLVNLAYIKSYNKGKGGSAIMIDGTEIEVSTRRKEDFLKKLAEI
jgi:two-component system LytT family response regulator